MLNCVLRDVNGNNLIMPQLLSLQINIDEGVPADSLYAVFPDTDTDELTAVTVYDGTKAIFVGIVDEEEHVRDGSGAYLKISARSLAAHLLDNEAMPCSFDHPSVQLIYERYAKPYGISMGDGDEVYFGEQTVLKGSSCWRVLKKFCTACYSSVPRVSSTGVLYPKGILRKELTVFGREDVRYISFREIKKRCEELSAVYVKTTNSGTYRLPIENADALRRGIRRSRYLNAALTESPMSCADAMLRNSRSKAYAVKLRCPACLLGTEGNRARVDALEDEKDLYISALHYRMNADGAYTDVTLKRRTS